MSEHDKRVRSLAAYMLKQGFSIKMVALSGYNEPIAVGRHEPDVISKNESRIAIGEAKTEDDYGSEHSLEQYKDFGESVADVVYLHLPLKFHSEVKQTLQNIGVMQKYILLHYASEKRSH